MPVVRLVASDACCWCVFEIGRLGMASFALGVHMLSVQFEACSRVIKSRVCPLALRVAIAALGSHRALMLVIGLVASETLCCQPDFGRW